MANIDPDRPKYTQTCPYSPHWALLGSLPSFLRRFWGVGCMLIFPRLPSRAPDTCHRSYLHSIAEDKSLDSNNLFYDTLLGQTQPKGSSTNLISTPGFLVLNYYFMLGEVLLA